MLQPGDIAKPADNDRGTAILSLGLVLCEIIAVSGVNKHVAYSVLVVNESAPHWASLKYTYGYIDWYFEDAFELVCRP